MILYQRQRSRYQVQAPLTALIDIVFLLLIYFLLTTNFMVEEGIKIKLPQAKASAPQTEEVITVYVDQEGRAYLENQEVSHAHGDDLLFQFTFSIEHESVGRAWLYRIFGEVIPCLKDLTVKIYTGYVSTLVEILRAGGKDIVSLCTGQV